MSRVTYRSMRWPKGWPQKEREAWEQRGGSPALARAFASLGWTPGQIRAATRSLLSLELVVPHCPAALFLPLGVALEELLAAGAPMLATDAVITTATCVGTTREIWQLVRTKPGWALTRHRHAERGAWPTTETKLTADSITEALLRAPELLTVRHGQVQLFTTDENLVPAATLLDLLRYAPPADERAECPAAESMTEDGDYLAEEAADVAWAPVWASINGTRVTGIRLSGQSHNDAVTLVLIDPWEWPHAFVGIDTVASFSWFSDGGGAPISWNGGSEITRLNRHFWLEQDWGDTSQDQELLSAPATPEQSADVVITWIERIDAEVFAALELEEFDPKNALTQRARNEWEETLSEVGASIHFDLPPEVLEIVRSRLRDAEPYASAAEAIRNPTSAMGRRLSAALADAAESGVIGDLMWGAWREQDEPREVTRTRSQPSPTARRTTTSFAESPRVVKLEELLPQSPPVDEHLKRWRERGFGIAVYNSSGSSLTASGHFFLSFGLPDAHLPERQPPKSPPVRYSPERLELIAVVRPRRRRAKDARANQPT